MDPVKDSAIKNKAPAVAASPTLVPVKESSIENKAPAVTASPTLVPVKDSVIERKTPADATSPSWVPVQDSTVERKAPAVAASPTSAESTASLSQHNRHNEHSREQKISATASARDRASSEIGGASSSEKLKKKSKHPHDSTGDLSPKDEADMAAPYSPSLVVSLAPSPAQALDPSNLSVGTVEPPGACSPLRSHPPPAAAEGSRTPAEPAFREEKNEAKIVLPIILAVAIVAILGAIIFTAVVRGHHAFKHSYLRSPADANSTDAPARRNAPSVVLEAATGEDRQAAPKKESGQS